MCQQIQGCGRVNRIEDCMAALAQQPDSVVIRSDSVLFQLYSVGDCLVQQGNLQTWQELRRS